MSDDSSLALPDELLLLALDDERGARAHATELEPGLAGAVLLDLTLRGRLDVVDETVRAIDTTPTGDAVLDRALTPIADAPKQGAPKWWVRHLQKGVREQVADRLVASGVLQRDEQKVLWVFPGADRRAVKNRLAELAEGQWAAEAVRRAVQKMAAATTVAATTAATSAATSGGA